MELDMRTGTIVLASFLGFALLGREPIEQNRQLPCAVVEEALEASLQIKAGMTRREVEKDFKLDGGVQFPHSARYLYSKCPFIKLHVDYKPTRGADSPNDTVIKVSKPYLDSPASD